MHGTSQLAKHRNRTDWYLRTCLIIFSYWWFILLEPQQFRRTFRLTINLKLRQALLIVRPKLGNKLFRNLPSLSRIAAVYQRMVERVSMLVITRYLQRYHIASKGFVFAMRTAEITGALHLLRAGAKTIAFSEITRADMTDGSCIEAVSPTRRFSKAILSPRDTSDSIGERRPMLDKRWFDHYYNLPRVITDPQIHLLRLHDGRFASARSHQVSLIESTCRRTNIMLLIELQDISWSIDLFRSRYTDQTISHSSRDHVIRFGSFTLVDVYMKIT